MHHCDIVLLGPIQQHSFNLKQVLQKKQCCPNYFLIRISTQKDHFWWTILIRQDNIFVWLEIRDDHIIFKLFSFVDARGSVTTITFIVGEKVFYHSVKHFPCVPRIKDWFQTTCGWRNVDRNFLFEWTNRVTI